MTSKLSIGYDPYTAMKSILLILLATECSLVLMVLVVEALIASLWWL